MTCIKTGAWVHMENYGAGAPADLFAVGDCIVVRFPRAFDDCCYFDEIRPVTHRVSFFDSEGIWWRKDLGVLVIPSYMIKEVAQ